jgi:hypothetical protein
MECIQCGTLVTTAFCPVCGQRTGVKRLTLRDTIADFWTSVIGLDGIFLRTLKDLSRRPGVVALSYIRGIRMKYFGPIGYFFFMITLLLLFISMLGMDFGELMRDRQEEMSIAQGAEMGPKLVTKWLSDHIKWVLFLAVPFQAIAARYFFFRMSGFNLMEHAVPLFYVSGHLFWLSMMTFLLRKLTGDLYSIPLTILSLAYFGFMYSDVMRYQSQFKAFSKGVGVYLAGQLLFVATLTLVGVLVILIMAWVDPAYLDVFKPLK